MDLRGRSLLKEIDLSAEEFLYRVTRVHRVRPGGEPAAHHQGGDGGDHRGNRMRASAAPAVTVLTAATVCGYEFRWLYQNRQPASGSGGTGKGVCR